MSDCCSTDTSDGRPCPSCGRTGPVVGEAPVLPHRAVDPGPWQHCATPECPVVFHLDDETVTVADARTRVGIKATSAPEPVCFCFSLTVDDLADDLVRHGPPGTIKRSIKAAVAAGLCACEHLNPSGQCCLAAVHRALRGLPAAPAATS